MALALNRIHPTKSVTTVSRRNLRLTSLRCQALAGEKRVYVGKRGRSHGGVAGRNTNCVKCLIEVTEDSFEDEVIKVNDGLQMGIGQLPVPWIWMLFSVLMCLI